MSSSSSSVTKSIAKKNPQDDDGSTKQTNGEINVVECLRNLAKKYKGVTLGEEVSHMIKEIMNDYSNEWLMQLSDNNEIEALKGYYDDAIEQSSADTSNSSANLNSSTDVEAKWKDFFTKFKADSHSGYKAPKVQKLSPLEYLIKFYYDEYVEGDSNDNNIKSDIMDDALKELEKIGEHDGEKYLEYTSSFIRDILKFAETAIQNTEDGHEKNDVSLATNALKFLGEEGVSYMICNIALMLNAPKERLFCNVTELAWPLLKVMNRKSKIKTGSISKANSNEIKLIRDLLEKNLQNMQLPKGIAKLIMTSFVKNQA